MAFLDSLFGSPQQTQQLPLYSQQQNQGQNQLLSRGLQGILGHQFDFAPIEQQARTQFSTQTVPSLAERFTAMGSGGSQRSSAFQGALGSAASGLESNLAGLRGQYNLAQLPFFQNLVQMGMRPQNEQILQSQQPGLFQGALPSMGSSLGSYLGAGGTAAGLGALGPVGLGIGGGLGLLYLLNQLTQ